MYARGHGTSTCMLFGWWHSLWELPGLQVSWHCCSSCVVAIPFGSFIPSPNSSIGVLTSFQWSPISNCICLTQLLVQPLRGQPCQAPVCKHNKASVIMSGIGAHHGMEPNLGWSLNNLIFSLRSTFVPAFLLDGTNSGSELLKVCW